MEFTVNMILDFSSSQPSLLQSINNLVSNVVNNAIVRTLGSPNLLGVSGFMFDILDDEEITAECDITDHYVEANYAIQDHIALRPIRFTLRAYVGELSENVQQSLQNLYSNAQGIATLGGILPGFNAQDAQFYSNIQSTATQTVNAINSVASLGALFGLTSTTATKQQSAFQFFLNMRNSRQLCTVETPFAVFENMAIERIVALQNGNNRYIGEFTITFKEIKTVQSISLSSPIASTASANSGSISNTDTVASNRVGDMLQADNPVNLGTIAGQDTSFSSMQAGFANQVGL